MTDQRTPSSPDAEARKLRSNMRRLSSWAQRWLAPGLQNSQFRYRKLLSEIVTSDADWLDLGCGHQLLPDWMPNWQQHEAVICKTAGSVTGVDRDESAIRRHQNIRRKVVADIQRLPFEDCSFDLVTANMVVEHVSDPLALLAEAHRVLRPGGLFAFHTPNALGYSSVLSMFLPQSFKNKLAALLQGRSEEDVYPTFYRLNTRRTIREDARRSRFAVSEMQMLESSAQTYMLGPLVLLELLWIRLLRLPLMENFRTNVIVILTKKVEQEKLADKKATLVRGSLHCRTEGALEAGRVRPTPAWLDSRNTGPFRMAGDYF